MEDSKVAVLLEEIRSHFCVLGEGFETLRDKVDGLDGKVDGLERKVDGLEMKVDQGFAQNQREHQQMMQMIMELNEEQMKLKR